MGQGELQRVNLVKGFLPRFTRRSVAGDNGFMRVRELSSARHVAH
jgi:hypothetical protein